jgi:dihydrofolate reductase
MNKPVISMIAAIGKKRELGNKGQLLWSIPEDMSRFKHLTKNHVVIMGQKTYESIGKALPFRFNIILSDDIAFGPSDCRVVNSIENALKVASEQEKDEVFVIGGGQIYKQLIEHADKLYLTLIDATTKADTFFPDYSEFKVSTEVGSGVNNGMKYKFMELTRDA